LWGGEGRESDGNESDDNGGNPTKRILLSTALTIKKRKHNKQQHSSDKKTGRRRRRLHPGPKFGAQFDLLIHGFWCARISPYTTKFAVCCNTEEGERERERERERREKESNLSRLSIRLSSRL